MIANFIEGLARYEFLQNALITSIIIGIVSGVIGSFIILRGMSLIGDAISHAVLPGVAVSAILGINYFIGAPICGVFASLLIGFVTHKSKIKNDTAIGIVFSLFMALGIITISIAKSSTDLHNILFGNVLAVQTKDVIITLVIAIIVILFVIIFFKELLISSFDSVMAKSYGLNTVLIHYTLIFLLTLVAVSAMQTVGTILVIAMLVTPAATAYLLTNKLKVMIIIASIIGSLSGVLGLMFSYTYNWASGSTIVLASGVFFIIAFIFSPKQGFLKKKIKKDKVII